VQLAKDAPTARRILNAPASVDLIILDVMMPGEDGLSFGERLRERQHHSLSLRGLELLVRSRRAARRKTCHQSTLERIDISPGKHALRPRPAPTAGDRAFQGAPVMSALGRGAIIKRMQTGELSVSPLLSKTQIGAASVDLRMGNVALIVRARGTSHVDPTAARSKRTTDHVRETRVQQKHERHELPFRARLLLHPGALVLVPTLEWVSLPDNIMGAVTARSTWAREGLSIATATLIEPGYQGIVTLELSNLGEIPITLYPGLEIAQIAFAEVSGDTVRPDQPQFALSFEPTQGKIPKESELPFLPFDIDS